MGASFFKDDNATELPDGGGLRACGLTANIISVTLSGSIQTLTLPQPAGTANVQGERMYLVTTDAQGAFFGIDAAAQSANYTGVTNMVRMPANWMWTIKAKATDTSAYVLQLGTAGVIQFVLLQ